MDACSNVHTINPLEGSQGHNACRCVQVSEATRRLLPKAAPVWEVPGGVQVKGKVRGVFESA